MQISGYLSTFLFLALSLTPMAQVPATDRNFVFSSNGEWGSINTAAYEASIDKNGSLVFKTEGMPSLKVALIRQWVAWQRFPQIKEMRAEAKLPEDKTSATLLFQYQWDDGDVSETLLFDSWGLEAKYIFTPRQERNVQFIALYVEPQPKVKEALRMTALAALLGEDKVLELEAANKVKGPFLALTLNYDTAEKLALLATGGTTMGMEDYPKILMRNTGGAGKWNALKKAGEPLEVSFRIFIAKDKKENVKNSPVEFREKNL